jgi:hypothetical protein
METDLTDKEKVYALAGRLLKLVTSMKVSYPALMTNKEMIEDIDKAATVVHALGDVIEG